MRIVVSTHDSLCPIKGGGALRTIKVAEEFKKLGHEVTLVAPTDEVGEISGIKVHWLHAPKKQRSQLLSSLKFNVRLLRKFLDLADAADMFFVHNTIAAATLPFLKKFYRFKFVLDITDVHAEYLAANRKTFIERLSTPLILAIEYWIIASADHVIVVTRAMKDLLLRHGIPEGKISIVYDAAETDQISAEKSPGFEKNIIHLGTVDRQHNVDEFIKAAPLILERHPDAGFLVVGGGRELETLIRLSKKLGVYDKFLFTGYLPCDAAREYLKKSGIGVIPRHDTLPNRIVTTLKIYEYWASATAVVATKMAGIAEIAGDGKDIVFVRSASPEDMAEKICFLLENREVTERIRLCGLKTTAQYTWAKMAPLIVEKAINL